MMSHLKSDERVIGSLCDKIPELSNAFGSHDYVATIELLRDYIYKKVNWGNDGLQYSRFFPHGLDDVDPLVVFDLLDAKEISFLCGATANFFAKVCRCFGFDSSPYNYGIRGVSTHVTTLVSVPGHSGANIHIQDATFNFSMSCGEEEDFSAVAGSIRSGLTDEIEIHQGKIRNRNIYFNPGADYHDALLYYKETGVLLEPLRHGRSMMTDSPYFYAMGDIDFNSYRRRRESGVLKSLGQLIPDGPAPHILNLILLPIALPMFASNEGRAVFSRTLPFLFLRASGRGA